MRPAGTQPRPCPEQEQSCPFPTSFSRVALRVSDLPGQTRTDLAPPSLSDPGPCPRGRDLLLPRPLLGCRRAEMKSRHDEIRKKYGESPSLLHTLRAPSRPPHRTPSTGSALTFLWDLSHPARLCDWSCRAGGEQVCPQPG